MTSQSRKKLPITPRGPITPVLTWVSLVLLWSSLTASAQTVAVPISPSAVPIIPVAYQPLAGTEGATDSLIQLDPPGLERLARLDSDDKLQLRLQQLNPNEKLAFPESPILSREAYAGRGSLWQRRQLTVEPNVVCYGKLQSLFEDSNTERYGWDLGPLGLALSLGKFGADTVTFPMRAFSEPCRLHECSAGHCLPGDPVPYLLYTPEVNVTGSAAQLAVIGALIVLFP